MLRAVVYYGDQSRLLLLPDRENATYDCVLPASSGCIPEDVALHFYAMERQWHVELPDTFFWLDNAPEIRSRRASDGFHMEAAASGGWRIGIHCCEIASPVLAKYLSADTMTIGRSRDSVIAVDDELVSEQHGVLRRENGADVYCDTSKNGTYINNRLVHGRSQKLQCGDVLHWACGVLLVYLGDMVALSAEARVRTSLKQAARMPAVKTGAQAGSLYEAVNRPPRFLPGTETKQYHLEAPPVQQGRNGTPLLMTLGPSLTMSIPMLMGSLLAGSSGYARSGIIMMATSSALAVTWALVNHLYGKRQRRQEYEALMEDYIRRLGNVEKEISQNIQGVTEQLYRLYPSGQEACERVLTGSGTLWERTPGAEGWLSIRLGCGMVALPYQISVPQLRMGEIPQGYAKAPYDLKAKFDHLHHAPVLMDMEAKRLVGVAGDHDRSVLYAMLLQLCAMHSYCDLRLAVIGRAGTEQDWQPLRAVPHFRRESSASAFRIATGKTDGQALLNEMNELLLQRLDTQELEKGSHQAEYLIIADDAELLQTHALLANVAAHGAGFHLCFIADTRAALPKECRGVFDAEQSCFYDMDAGTQTDVETERLPLQEAEAALNRLARLRDLEQLGGAGLPERVSFLAAHGVSRTEELDIARRWHENSTAEHVLANLGLGADGQPFLLNLSDQFHGPHGIVAGTTGAGKSVLLQTLVLSLALNYHPYEMQFILIDYKGGGSFEPFRRLPHVVGMIDNLQDVRQISRALQSVRGEVLRRETLFKQCEPLYGVNVSDINSYIRLRRSHPEMQPLAHLMIIIDEFAELRDENEDFIPELISTARIGRSVGLHLLLATQKPGSSIGGEIWANTRFHICLRVQSREESMEVLHRPEAAFLRGMGRCYVQVGSNEVFEQVQTSYSGQQYDLNAVPEDQSPRLLDHRGYPVPLPRTTDGLSTTQLQAVMDEIGRVTQQYGVTPPQRLWLDELPAVLTAEEHTGDSGAFPRALPVTIGLVDDVANQRYLEAELDLMALRAVAFIGHSACGKTTALQTLAYDLACRYTPAQVQVIALSLSGSALTGIAALPIVSDVLTAADAREQRAVASALDMLCQERDAIFSAYETDNFSACNESRIRRGEAPLPAMVVMVDRLSQWFEMYRDAEQERLATLMKTCAGRGIYFVVTATEGREFPYRLREGFHCIPLAMPSLPDYAELLRCRLGQNAALPHELPGRGMLRMGGACYELQVALAFGERYDAVRREKLAAFAAALPACTTRALEIHRAPPGFGSAELWAAMPAERTMEIPVAFEQNQLQPVTVDLFARNNVFVFGLPQTGKSSMLRALASAHAGAQGDIFVIAPERERPLWQGLGGNLAFLPIGTPAGKQEEESSLLDDWFKERIAVRKEAETRLTDAREVALENRPLSIVLDDAHMWYGGDEAGERSLYFQLDRLIDMAVQFGAKYNICVFAACAAANSVPGALHEIWRRSWSVVTGNTLSRFNPWHAYLPYHSSNEAMCPGEGHLIDGNNVIRVYLPMN